MTTLRKSLAVFAAIAALAVVAVPNTGAQQPAPQPGVTEVLGHGDALGADINSAGHPVVLANEYRLDDETFLSVQGSTYLIQCTAVDCSGSPVVTELPFGVTTGHGEQLVLDASDRPVITSFDSGEGLLKVFACEDPACNAWSQGLVVMETGGDASPIPWFLKDVVAMEFAPDGALHVMVNSPLLSTGDSAFHVRCSDATCVDAHVTLVRSPVSSMALDPDGLPAYTTASELVRCGDPTCTSTTSGTVPGSARGVTFGASGFPLVLVSARTYFDEEFPTENWGLLMHCDDPLCVDEEPYAHRVVTSSVETSHRHSYVPLSVHIGPYGIPVVGHYYNLGFDSESEDNESYRFHAECIAVHCTGPSNTAADRFQMGRGYTGFPTYFLATPDDTPVVYSAGSFFHDYPEQGAVVVRACLAGAYCFPDEDGDGRPDWSEVAEPPEPTYCREDAVTVDLAAGDVPTPGDDVILGTAGPDMIAAGAGDDVICGGGGDDSIWGQDGNDIIYGDDGDDRLRGGDGDDLLFGGAGSDDLNGGRDNDEVWGQDGDDTAVRGGTGDDLVNGGAGNDVVVAGNGGLDVVHGAAGNDKVTGGPRPDEVRGGSGNDLVKGNNGADSVHGDTGDDMLYGGPGRDTLVGGNDNDLCNGGVGDDSSSSCEALINVP